MYNHTRHLLGDYMVNVITSQFFFLQLHDEDNEQYKEFSDVISHVINPKSNATFNQPLTLFELMSNDLVHYFTYNGSLTTPPCSEIVTWIDFQEPILLSHRQVRRLRFSFRLCKIDVRKICCCIDVLSQYITI